MIFTTSNQMQGSLESDDPDYFDDGMKCKFGCKHLP